MAKTLEELKKEWDAARDAVSIAYAAEKAAREAYYTASADATGLLGHLVEYDKRRGYGSTAKTVVCRFVVDGCGSWGQGVGGPVIKADGSRGIRRDSVYDIKKLRDLGPYESSHV